MRRNRATVWVAATAGSLLLASGAAAQSSGNPRANERNEPPPIRRGAPVPLPRNDPPPLGTTDRLPDVPPARDRVRDSSGPRDRNRTPDEVPQGDNRDGGDSGRPDRPGDDARRDRWRHRPRAPIYYDPPGYDRYRDYDDVYREYDNEPVGDPRDRAPRDDDARNAPPPGALLPPEGMLDEDVPPPLRKALDESPQYREATAQLLRAWAAYAQAAEQIVQRLKLTAPYRRALAQLRDAEAKVAEVRAMEARAPAENLVTAAHEALFARRAVRKLEEDAINADPLARRAKQQVDQAIERRNKIRDDIAGKIPDLGNPDADERERP